MANVNKTVDVAALELLCDKLECGDANHRATAAQIRKAMNGVERSNDGVDVDALKFCADYLDEIGHGDIADTIRAAFEGETYELFKQAPQLPEGIEWPRFKDGELVKFGDEINVEGVTESVTYIGFYETHVCVKTNAGSYEEYYKFKHGEPLKRPETEVLDADGVPIKVGDTVYKVGEHHISGERTVKIVEPGLVWFVENLSWAYPSGLTHRKPDTLESVVTEMLAEWDENNEEFLDMDSYFARFRKLMGGE